MNHSRIPVSERSRVPISSWTNRTDTHLARVSHPSAFEATLTLAISSLRVTVRDRTVIWLGALFMAMVLVSAYLGWSATHTVNAIYDKAVTMLQAEGRDIPPNPIGEASPLSMLRNMTTYIALLGALVTIVFGGQLITEDRRSGVFPLIASRPAVRAAYALGKIGALVTAIIGILAVAALVNGLAILILPSGPKTADTWLRLTEFYGVSALFLVAFGLIAMASAAWSRSESMGLLIPVAIWLAMTFVFPQLVANINPMAALNPISALAPPPAGPFFEATSALLTPVSLTSAYRDIAATILGLISGDNLSGNVSREMLTLVGANLAAATAAMLAILHLEAARSETVE